MRPLKKIFYDVIIITNYLDSGYKLHYNSVQFQMSLKANR